MEIGNKGEQDVHNSKTFCGLQNKYRDFYEPSSSRNKKQSCPKTVSQFKRMKKNEVSWNSLVMEAQSEAKNLILSHKQLMSSSRPSYVKTCQQ